MLIIKSYWEEFYIYQGIQFVIDKLFKKMPFLYMLEFHTVESKTKIPHILKQTAWTKVLLRVFKNLNQAPDRFQGYHNLPGSHLWIPPNPPRLTQGLGYWISQNPGGLTDCQNLKNHKEERMWKYITSYNFSLDIVSSNPNWVLLQLL